MPEPVGADTATAPQLLARAKDGNRLAVGRLLTLVERGGDAAEAVDAATLAAPGDAHVIGITGPPGAGKSTLIDQLATHAAAMGKRPAVLAVDPSSPLTGGAILGDRVRMGGAARSDVFIRSMASRGHAGGLALATPAAVRVLGAAGFDPVLIETVGAGQLEVEVAEAADTTVVVVTPGWGDAIQASKAGLLEVADVLVVNKADRPGADDTRRDLELMVMLSEVTSGADHTEPPIVMTSATEGTGIRELLDAVTAHHATLAASGRLAEQRAARTRAEVRSHLEQLLRSTADRALETPEGRKVLQATAEGGLTPGAAARSLLTSALAERPATRR